MDNSQEDKKIKVINSPIRWAGSKKQLIEPLFKYFPKDKKIYVEPFLGSGVVLLNVLNNSDVFMFDEYFVNDSNKNVIFFYNQLKNKCNDLVELIEKKIIIYNQLSISDKEEYYYKARESFNKDKLNAIERASLFYFLTRTCFNGVYRENSKGYYNVPFGKKEFIFFPKDNLLNISKLIKKVKFFNFDYKDFLENIMSSLEKDDTFVYCDPPYIPDDDSIYQIQVLYSKNRFNHQEFVDIIGALKDDCDIFVSMSESSKANTLYTQNLNKIIIRDVKRIVNPVKNKPSLEVLYTNITINK